MSETINTIRIGLLGFGTVGTGVYRILSRFPHIEITKIAVRDLTKTRAIPDIPSSLFTDSPLEVVQHPEVDVVVELMGGLEFPAQMIQHALEMGKHVVTANKVVIANEGPKLFKLAAEKNVNLLFEAAVAGGIPIITPLKLSLAGNNIRQIAGILNGTTNYILTRMEQAGLDFAAALKEAQDKGFAEADPTADVEGHDAACKIGILSSIAYRQTVDQKAIYSEGISTIGPVDIEMAATLGYAIRLIALGKATEGSESLDLRVHPMLVPLSHPLSKITFENNAIWVQGDAVGDVMFYGKGAGELPTASSVVGDILLIANALQQNQGGVAGMDFQCNKPATYTPIKDTNNAYYIRVETNDESGVIGQLGKACGDHNVSLDAIMQKGTRAEDNSATIVMLTHEVSEADMQAALSDMRRMSSIRNIHTVLRVFAS